MDKIIACIATFLMAGIGVLAPIITSLAEPEAEPEAPVATIAREEPIEAAKAPVSEMAPEPEPAPEPETHHHISANKPLQEPVQITVPQTPPPEQRNDDWQDPSGLTSTDEYIRKYAGLCPSAQPRDSLFWDMQRFLAFANHSQHKWPTPLYYADVYWSWYMIDGVRTGEQRVASFENMQLDTGTGNRHIGIYINYNDLSFFWDSMFDDERPYQVSSYATESAIWQQTADEMTAYIRQLNANYITSCPNN